MLSEADGTCCGGKLVCGAGGSSLHSTPKKAGTSQHVPGREELRNAFSLCPSCRFLLLNCFPEKAEKAQPQPTQGYF